VSLYMRQYKEYLENVFLCVCEYVNKKRTKVLRRKQIGFMLKFQIFLLSPSKYFCFSFYSLDLSVSLNMRIIKAFFPLTFTNIWARIQNLVSFLHRLYFKES